MSFCIFLNYKFLVFQLNTFSQVSILFYSFIFLFFFLNSGFYLDIFKKTRMCYCQMFCDIFVLTSLVLAKKKWKVKCLCLFCGTFSCRTCFNMFRHVQMHSRNVIVSYVLYLNVQFCLNVQATVIEWRGVNVFWGVSAAVLCMCVLVCFGVHVSAAVIQRRSHRLLHVILWSIRCCEHWFFLFELNQQSQTSIGRQWSRSGRLLLM